MQVQVQVRVLQVQVQVQRVVVLAQILAALTSQLRRVWCPGLAPRPRTNSTLASQGSTLQLTLLATGVYFLYSNVVYCCSLTEETV